ncbi:helix-turn-helix transcriptional regulator [Cohnella hongkongensis]|uniref:AraC family transcriptional regulator n=1 Tax=Cohnella hongkongensis TaxID=178337 RepID=A0ABV9FBQ9_9BACL
MQEYDYEFAEFIYYTPGSLDRDGRLWPVRAGRSLAKPNYKVGPKRIECYSLHFVQDGMIRLEYGDRHADLRKGDLFCLFPGLTYHYRMLPSDAPLRMSWLALDGDRVRPLLELAGLTPDKPYGRERIDDRVRESAERTIQALQAGARWSPSTALELHGLVCGLFADLIPDTAAVYSSEPAGWIEECLEYMELHASEGISVQQVADFAGVHRSYFTQTFTRQIGISPMKFIQRIRMEKASRLLRETNATVTEIALSLGYPNVYTFTRAFKSYYRVSPQALRSTGS